MTPSLRMLLTGIIDYAGLFPPARLPLDQAIRNYARYRQEPDRWMLGRFVCPAAHLAELLPFVLELFPAGPPLLVAALGRGGNTTTEYLEGLQHDLKALTTFRASVGERAQVDVLETRLPQELVADTRTPPLLDCARITAQAAQAQSLTPFLEIGLGNRWRTNLTDLIGACKEFGGKVGMKLRTGGLEATAFPTAEQVAFALAECGLAGVPLKFTAGLHHPLRHFDPGIKTPMHGFINLFVAGVLGGLPRLKTEVLCELVQEESPAAFRWEEEGLRWQEYHAGLAEIEQARRQRVISFGSCSFDEPRDDLRALGWM